MLDGVSERNIVFFQRRILLEFQELDELDDLYFSKIKHTCCQHENSFLRCSRPPSMLRVKLLSAKKQPCGSAQF